MKALSNVDIVIKPGEIHGLLGQNGCGKSTLIKVLSGFQPPDEGGRVWVNGQELNFPLSPSAFQDYSMSFVHQDLGLIPDLTVLENLCIGELAISNSMHIDWKAQHKRAEEMFAKYHLKIDPDKAVASLGPVEKAMLAIVRAVNAIEQDSAKGGKGLLVLDEPTVFLPRAEVDTLFRVVRKIAEDGMGIMFVSHDLDEVMELTHEFTVLRDGMNCGTRNTKSVKKTEIIEMILGKSLQAYQIETKKEGYFKHVSVNVKNICGDIVKPSNISVYKGEVLGLTGLVGSGFEEIPYLLFGSADNRNGTLMVEDNVIDIKKFNPGKAVEMGLALTPADRQNAGAIRDLQVDENILMRSLNRFNNWKLDKKAMRSLTSNLVKQYDVFPPNDQMNMGQLSGGNQQKVILAKWLQANPKLLILHEPTQGIDVGARQQIYSYIEKAAQEGVTVICSSSDYEQLEQICDRVLIFVNGQIANELIGSEIKKDIITKLCYDSTAM